MILVDVHEPLRICAELEKAGIEITRTKLDIGDYVVGRFLIERKEIGDFLRSTYSARLFDQLKRLSEQKELETILAVIGEIPPKTEWRKVDGRAMEVVLSKEERERKERSIIATINSAIVSFKPSVLLFQKERQFIKFLIDLHYRQTEHVPRKPVVGRKGTSIEDTVFCILTSIRGIGSKRAMRLINKGYSLLELYKLSKEDQSPLKKLLPKNSIEILKEVFEFKKRM